MRNSFSPFNWVLPTDALECLKAVLPPMLHVVPTENGLEPWSSKVESSTSCHLHTSLSRHVKKPPKRHSKRLLCRSFADVHHLAPHHSVRQSQQDINNLGAPLFTIIFRTSNQPMPWNHEVAKCISSKNTRNGSSQRKHPLHPENHGLCVFFLKWG